MRPAQLKGSTAAAFILSTLLGGFNSIGVRFTIIELPPFWGAALRLIPASLILFGIALALRLPMPRGRSLLGALLFGSLNFGSSYVFIYWGLRAVHPGMATVLLSLVPLITLLLAIAQRQEAFHWQALGGSLLAVAGVAVVFGGQARAGVPFLAILSIILGGVSIAEASILVKKYPMENPISTNAVGLAFGSAILLLMMIISGETPLLPRLAVTWFWLAYLILPGTCGAFILVLYVLKRWSASATAYLFVLMPFITVTGSALLTGERLSSTLLVGAALVLAGVYTGALRRPARAQSPLPVRRALWSNGIALSLLRKTIHSSNKELPHEDRADNPPGSIPTDAERLPD